MVKPPYYFDCNSPLCIVVVWQRARLTPGRRIGTDVLGVLHADGLK